MGELEDKLNRILSSPETMAQVMNIAQSLGMGGDFAAEDPPPTDPSDLFRGFDPELLSRFLPLLGELNSPGSGRRDQLLAALRPFLTHERQSKLDRAMQTARLLRVGKKVLGEL